MDTSNQKLGDEPWRERLLARLVAQIRLGRELPADPWQDTLPEARRRDEK